VRNKRVLEVAKAVPRRGSGTLTRRKVLAGAAGLGLAFPALSADPRRPFRTGLFPHTYEPSYTWGEDDFSARGWQVGGHYTRVNYDAGVGDALTVEAARALIARNVDLLTTYTTAHALVLHRLTQTVLIVMYSSGYPVEARLANSLARPGKNVTGITAYPCRGHRRRAFETTMPYQLGAPCERFAELYACFHSASSSLGTARWSG